MIRVMHVIATLDGDGAQRQMAALVSRLDRARFAPSVCVLTRGGPVEDDLRRAGAPFRILGKKWKFDFGVLSKIREMIDDEQADVVHTWMFTANAFGRRAAFQSGVRAVIAAERNVDAWKPWLYRAIDRRYARRTFRIVCNSRDVLDHCVRDVGLPPEKLVVIENGLDIDRLRPSDPAGLRRELDVPDGAPLIGTAGRLMEQKAVHRLIDALEALPGVHARIAGEGPLRAELERRIAAAGLADRCRLVGYVDRIADFLAMLDVFVLCSTFEGSPNALAEAMALGRPVVAVDAPGTRTVVRDRETGLLVAPESLADGIRALLVDEELRSVLAVRGRADVLDRFSMSEMVARYQALYEEAVLPPGA